MTGRFVHHEAAVGLHRSAEVDGRFPVVGVIGVDADLAEYVEQLQVDGPVDDQPHGALLVVFAQQHHGAREVRVGHGRHGDQEVVVERFAFHGRGQRALPKVSLKIQVRVMCRTSVSLFMSAVNGMNGADISTMRMAASSSSL